MNIPRNEYPRPQFVREDWLNLNGEWEFSFDSDTFDRTIIVPYAYQTKLSGINIREFHDVVWYKRSFELRKDMYGKVILLHFGAVDYECDVWVNDIFITHHTGGHIGFDANITHAIHIGQNEIKLKVMDRSTDLEMPRGKQYWEEESKGIFYTRTTGIWQTVWIEAVNNTYLANVWITPDLDDGSVEFQYEIVGQEEVYIQIEVNFGDVIVANQRIATNRNEGKFKITIDTQEVGQGDLISNCAWSPEQPNLFDVKYQVIVDNNIMDTVTSYFGLRKISIEDGVVMLNNRKYYQKLILDQGYWKDSLLTAPTDEDYIKDIRLCKDMGFNGARKHQKIEDPRYLYYADKMGFLVWGEIASAYVYSKKYVKRITNEWMDEILRDYNHPCIIAWTPLNESWGVLNIRTDSSQQNHSVAMVSLTKSLDSSRLVISNDGWEQTVTDLLTIHDYDSKKLLLKERYSTLDNILKFAPAGRMMFAKGYGYVGQPILVTECGGISKQLKNNAEWGYTNADSDDKFIQCYNDVISAFLESPLVQGFCYTQLTDVEQEVNGLLTYEREPKIDVAIIRQINEGIWAKKDVF